VAVQAVHDTDGPPISLEVINKGFEHAQVAVELDLTGAIENKIIVLAVTLEEGRSRHAG